MVPPDSLTQELSVPNHQIARGISCVISIEFISSASDSDQVIALSAAAALQANAP